MWQPELLYVWDVHTGRIAIEPMIYLMALLLVEWTETHLRFVRREMVCFQLVYLFRMSRKTRREWMASERRFFVPAHIINSKLGSNVTTDLNFN